MRKLALYTIGLLLFSVMSCTEEAEVWDSSTLDFAGEWWAEGSLDGNGYGMTEHQTFNTAADDGSEMWITDGGHFWDYKVKCPINKTDLTFGGTDLINAVEGYDIKISITDGKILKNAAHSTSGVVVDSIYYKIEFEDDLGTIYEVKGLRKTGFAEDNY
ncbi:MAG: hypothetical protein K0M40_23060 [Prolixibacteraceae bacterium]|nr:hypothetical protein [Prolixibacteraceae bacterium]